MSAVIFLKYLHFVSFLLLKKKRREFEKFFAVFKEKLLIGTYRVVRRERQEGLWDVQMWTLLILLPPATMTDKIHSNILFK